MTAPVQKGIKIEIYYFIKAYPHDTICRIRLAILRMTQVLIPDFCSFADGEI